MAGPELPETPAQLKTIQPYLKIANEHDQRDVVVSYWCRLYALQTGLKLSTKTSEETNFLLKLMDWLETTKKANQDNEAITNDVAAQAHVENWALKLFLYADKQDRASNFGKNVIQSFYTSGLLYDVLSVFGELSDEVIQNRKYAKWKAAYIHNCLKNGETPQPGPMKEESDDSNENINNDPAYNEDSQYNQNIHDYGDISQASLPSQPTLPMYPMMPMQPPIPSEPPACTGAFDFPSVPATDNEDDGNNENENSVPENEDNENKDNEDPAPETEDNENRDNEDPAAEVEENKDENNEKAEPHPYNPAPTPTNPGISSISSFDNKTSVLTAAGDITLSIEQTSKAQKYIKWAGSALNYDDIPTTITNLQKALHLLTTGEDPV